MKSRTTTILFLFALFFFLLRLYNLEKLVNFSGDQGEHLLGLYKIFQERRIQLIGPLDTSKIIEGRGFFIGPAYYYVLLPILVYFKWNPLAGSYFLVFLSFLGGLILFLLTKEAFDIETGILALFIYCFSPITVEYSRFIWNPNFFLLISPLFAYCIFRAIKSRKFYWFLLSGFIAGVGFQFHYIYFFPIILTAAILLIKTKKVWIKLPLFLAGFILGYSPMIIFELRHNFYNLRTIILFLQKWSSQKEPLVSLVPTYSLILAFYPLIVLCLAVFFKQLLTYRKILFYLVILLFLVYSLLAVNPTRLQAFGMPTGWNYLGLKKTEEIIIHDADGSKYNIASLIYGNTRDYPLRYLLTVKNKSPLPADKYPEADILYVVSRFSSEEVLTYPVWEIHSFLPAKVVKSWEIQNGIKLYRLEKIKQQS